MNRCWLTASVVMFERSLSSLIKGLRSHRGRDEPRYVATLMDEIKYEIRSGDMDVKAEAVLKLTYVSVAVDLRNPSPLTAVRDASCKCLGIRLQTPRFTCSRSWPRLDSISSNSATSPPHSASTRTLTSSFLPQIC